MFKIAALAVLVPMFTPVHEAPLGWVYGMECCSGRDCHQLKSDAVGETKKGYVIRSTGELILYTDQRIKRSRDEYYHQCVATPMATHSYCLYVPDRGF